jgi:hypothetical protein
METKTLQEVAQSYEGYLIMSKEAMKLALEALEPLVRRAAPYGELDWLNGCKAITALREALAEQPAQQEPVAWKHDCAALLTNDVELWIDRCPHCGKPRTSQQPAQQEPVAYLVDDDLYYPEEIDWESLKEQGHTVASLYTSPPAQKECEKCSRKND